MNDPYARMFDMEGSWNTVDSHPEKLGLTTVAQLRDPEAYYSFDDLVIVRDDATGALFGVMDSGCSCPIPFENVRGLPDMTPIRSTKDFNDFVASHWRGGSTWLQSDRWAAERAVRDALLARRP